MDAAAMGRNETRQAALNELRVPQHVLRGRRNALETRAELTEHPRTVHCTEPTSHTNAQTPGLFRKILFSPPILFLFVFLFFFLEQKQHNSNLEEKKECLMS